jgi:hypothetical protein
MNRRYAFSTIAISVAFVFAGYLTVLPTCGDSVDLADAGLPPAGNSQVSGAASNAAKTRLEWTQTRLSDFETALNSSTLSSLADFLRKYYVLHELEDGTLAVDNAPFVDRILPLITSQLDSIPSTAANDSLPTQFHSALVIEAREKARRPSPSGLAIEYQGGRVELGPGTFGGNPAHMNMSFPLPRGRASYLDLHATLTFGQDGQCQDTKVEYSRGSIVVLDNGNIYLYDGRSWKALYPGGAVTESGHHGPTSHPASPTKPVDAAQRIGTSPGFEIQDVFLDPDHLSPSDPAGIGIYVQLPADSRLSMEVFNLAGTRVKKVEGVAARRGITLIQWDGLDNAGEAVGTGIYLCKLSAILTSQPEQRVTRIIKVIKR